MTKKHTHATNEEKNTQQTNTQRRNTNKNEHRANKQKTEKKKTHIIANRQTNTENTTDTKKRAQITNSTHAIQN